MSKCKKGDWVLIRGGAKAHFLVQGYDSLTPICSQATHCKATGNSDCNDIEQEEMTPCTTKDICTRCASVIRKLHPLSKIFNGDKDEWLRENLLPPKD